MNTIDNITRGIGALTRHKTWLVAALTAVAAFTLGVWATGGENEQPPRRPAVATEAVTWTCSMHPQIKLPQPGKCPICFMDLIPLETDAGGDLGPRQIRMSDAARELADIQTTPAARDFAAVEVRMVGKVTYDETNLAYISAWVPGRLDKLYADFTGMEVDKGDPLMRIYSPDLLVAQEELIQAQAAVTASRNSASALLRSGAEATLRAARDKLRLYGLSQDQIERLETTGLASDFLTVYAPIGGVVVHKDAREGMYVATGTRIYTIADINHVWITFQAYESDLPWLRVGQPVEFNSPSFPGRRFEAVIDFIDPVVDPGTRTIRVRAGVENKDNELKPDMFVHGVVKARVESGQPDLLIPASAPLITGKRAVVYVEVAGGEHPVFEGREIELGPRAGDYYVVQSGIREGEPVVTNGAFKIDSELQIQAKPSMMSPPGGGVPAGRQHGTQHSMPAMDAGDEHKDAGTHEKKPVENGTARAALNPVYDAYFNVQMALAKDDLKAAKKAGAEVTAAVKNVGETVFSRVGQGRWLDLSQKIAKQGEVISKAKDLTQARDGFFYLSQAVIDLHNNFGHSGDRNFYLTHCPMARDGGGADWLQTENIVWNSFYGASMLRCGSIEGTLPPEPDEKKQ